MYKDMIKGVEQRNARADRKNRKKRCKIEDVRIRLTVTRRKRRIQIRYKVQMRK